MTMPPKIWAQPDFVNDKPTYRKGDWFCDAEAIDEDTPYIRADRVEKLVEALRAVLGKHIAHHNSIEHAAARAVLAEWEADQ